MEKVCIFPICGSASRIVNIPKFLLPISNNNTLLLNSINNTIHSGFKVLIITTPDYSNIIYNYLKNKIKNFSLFIKINITETNNMSETMLFNNYLDNNIYGLIMPDTYFIYENNLKKMYDIFIQDKCSVVLGIFKIRNEQKGKLGQVLFDENNNVIDIIDKDEKCNYEWAWGCIIFNNKLTKFFNKNDSHIGYSLKPYIQSGNTIKVCKFDNLYYDCGTFNEYKNLLTIL